MSDMSVENRVLEVKKQIEKILFDVHNKYASKKFEDVSEIYDIFEFEKASKENDDKMEKFMEIYEDFIGLDACNEVVTENILIEYQKIQKKLEAYL